ncbi:2-succinyl-5-enolpyruvyl-6-hydroxy-3-cyclohexene-1-carboxylic-acid synthase [Halanaeroarchaeum sulfurireducens]|uniref:2-succinyl-5-enolpyruvyl-6-hydroxy-3-cyclohexene-1-carboxylate synthase n=1 Tax=Halanaeroarchaeum sulfurireducens TaxID=1604004 RepID=A0A0F7PDS3_9EURY|nr:2-succinyl-5-enolpyruvyl-6-hydroxy-3-cyclohexene-1-carboxylic-acid synthase [Halanaeroarchaeum sulfurireducens]AKH97794.1 2-succinyl-5-enolpyruvyl-6-hydroxy-3-cyclohexene-1-carboxylic-acid synthase [Halanaeroarchaeum sulfurireducens]ALG82188.1 2-succinyl-5-enolpyruvyl-6-hydroxy-3-cyclohexene -1-carboxylic-acid synthase [Halanaeroarchaeum sulfurireducens]
MTAPNRNTLWARAILDEIVKAGVDAAVVAPGSRSTPLTVAAAREDRLAVYSHLDERSAAYFALGRARRTGSPTALVCTSGTAAANFHPAVVEASRARVPMILLTADRPPELRDSGANQTIDQVGLYGSAVREDADLPEPEPDARKLRSLRTTVSRAVATARGTPPGPVHLNVPFKKPLEPVEVPGDVPDSFADEHPLAARGRDGPFVRHSVGTPTLGDAAMAAIREDIEGAERGLIVAGPDDAFGVGTSATAALAEATGFPVFADPLSGVRFGPHRDRATIVGAYDGFLDTRVYQQWADPDVVLRFGASPTSKALRTYLAAVGARQYLVDPAGEWREATFTASDLVAADPTRFARTLGETVSRSANAEWHATLEEAADRHWSAVEAGIDGDLEGAYLHRVVAGAPDPATIVVANSMPVRDLDRFGRPRDAALTVLGNRGASGIDGTTSTALGAGSATDDPLVLVTGDLTYFHDMNGLLALGRFGVDATIVLIDNDGGGIFHTLPIEDFEPPFTDQFKTPHGLDLSASEALYDLSFVAVEDLSTFDARYRESLSAAGTQVIAVETDAERSHRRRESIQRDVVDALV